MKRLIIYNAIILSLAFTGVNSFAQCQARQIIQQNKSGLSPYSYDSYALNEVIIDPDKPQLVEIEFTAFAGQKYKLVFCTSGVEEDIKLNIYDKKKNAKDRNKIYDTANGIEKHWQFEPTKPGTYYIDYEIPKSANGQSKTACTVMLVGYMD